MSAGDADRARTAGLSPLPRDDGQLFGEPWQAQAFALAVALQEAHLFTPKEWASALGRQIAAEDLSATLDSNDRYYRCWLAALESLLVEKGVASFSTVRAREAAWERASLATPHGQPILLANDPQSAATAE